MVFPFYMLKLGTMCAELRSDWLKALLACVVWPLAREVVFACYRESVRAAYQGDPVYRFATWFLLFLFATLVGRFLITAIEDQGVLTAVAVIQGVQEVVMRLTGPYRDRFFMFFWRKWNKIPNDSAWKEYFAEGLAENRAQVLLTEMMVEYLGIVLAPVFVYTHSAARLEFNLGYGGVTPVKGEALLEGFLIQFLIEIPVDIICCWFEMNRRKLPLRGVWNQQRLFSLPVLCMCLGGSFLTLNSFSTGFSTNYKSCGWSIPEPGVTEYTICTKECLVKLDYSVYHAVCEGAKLTGLP